MKENNNEIGTFDNICRQLSTWILEYRSSTYKTSIFLIWYTDSDENNTDRLLTFNTGQIFASGSLFQIKEIMTNNLEGIDTYENFNRWLGKFNNLIPEVNAIYDMDAICHCLEKSQFDIETLESLANFINLFHDFIDQNERNEYLSIYRENKFIDRAWHYFYDKIFWPRFNDYEKFTKWDRPKFVIDNKKLLQGFQKMRNQFEQRITLVLS